MQGVLWKRFNSMLGYSKGQKYIRKISSIIDSSVPFSNPEKKVFTQKHATLFRNQKGVQSVPNIEVLIVPNRSLLTVLPDV